MPHRSDLSIRAADFGYRAAAAPADDTRIEYGIVATHLWIAAATPPHQLYDLYDQWNRAEVGHPAHARALCRCLEILDEVLDNASNENGEGGVNAFATLNAV